MKIVVSLNFTEKLVLKIIRGIMGNYPEASRGNSLHCSHFNYKELRFTFVDIEEDKTYNLKANNFVARFPLLFEAGKWPKGCTPLPASTDWETWDDWLGQADAIDFDAFVQLVCLGEVIYG